MMEPVPLARSAAVALAAAGLLGAWGVGAAAWAAHAAADPRAGSLVETASRILLVHAATLVALAALSGRDLARWPGLGVAMAAILMGAGAAVFAGALHASVLDGPRWLAATAPWGGMALIAGWLILATSALAVLLGRRR
jgi:uncharacterized membrane protein YgdD (TMEM256/DUF423 family)